MKLKTVEVDGKTYAEVNDGKPVYVEDDGKETAFDAVSTKSTISRLFGENKSYRERLEAAETGLKRFEGITDADAARKALETVKNLDEKKLRDAGEVERANAERDKAWQAKLDESDAKLHATVQSWHQEKINGLFQSSTFLNDKTTLTPDIAAAFFGKHVKIDEDGEAYFTDPQGNKILSRANPGHTASADEAIEFLVDLHPQKDRFLASSGQSGTGSRSSAGGGGSATAKRSDMTAEEKGAFIRDHGQQAYLQLPK